MDWSFIIGLLTGFILRKAAFNLSDKPQLIEALMATSCLKPSSSRCSLVFIFKKTNEMPENMVKIKFSAVLRDERFNKKKKK